jgi:hypothetical protein
VAAQQRDALGTRQRLDAPHVRGRRRLGRQLEHADLGGRAHVGAAAQLARPRAVADLHDPDDVAVLLAEQRHGAQPPRLLERHRQRADRLVARDLRVDAVLDGPDVLIAQRGAVGEVEAQLVRADVRAGLAHVVAQALAQGSVQQVGGRVVALGGVADRRRDARHHPRALAQRPVLDLEDEGLVVAQAQHVGHAGAAAAVLALDHAGVGDLPPPVA